MKQKKENWVLGIENEITSLSKEDIYYPILLLISILVLYLSFKSPEIFGIFPNILSILSLIIGWHSLNRIGTTYYHPNHLAYYLHKIGEDLPIFEIEDYYLKRNKKYITKCGKQLKILSDPALFKERFYFIDEILGFYNKLYSIILRLNYLYNEGEENPSLMNKMESLSSEQSVSKGESLSLKFIELANLIHTNYSSLTQEHVILANKILEELNDIPEKPFHRPFIEYINILWNSLHYKLRIVLFLSGVFGLTFLILSKILIEFGQGNDSIKIAIGVSGVLTAAALNKIDLFVTHEK